MHRVLVMRHKLNAQPEKLLLNIIGLPSSENILKLMIKLIMLVGKEVNFDLNKSKVLYPIEQSFPHGFCIHSELEDPAIFEGDR